MAYKEKVKSTSVMIGNESLLIKCGEIWLNYGNEIKAVITANNSIVKWASDKNISVFKNHNDFKENFNRAGFDYLFSITNLSVLPAEIIEMPEKMAVNFHDGPLPNYAGLNATSWAIFNREKKHGITWHVMNSQIDRGDIIEVERFPIADDETALTLNAKCYTAAMESFERMVQKFEKETYTLTKQDLEIQSYFGKYKKPSPASIFNFKMGAEQIDSFVRGLNFGSYNNPIGSAKFKLSGDYIIVLSAQKTGNFSVAMPGTVIEVAVESITVSTANYDIRLSDFNTVHGDKITVDELCKKYKLNVGTILEENSESEIKYIDQITGRISRNEEYWVKKISAVKNVDLSLYQKKSAKSIYKNIKISSLYLPASIAERFNSQSKLLSTFMLFLSKISGEESFDIGYSNDDIRNLLSGYECLFADVLPLRIKLMKEQSFYELCENVEQDINEINGRVTYLHDISARYSSINNKAQRVPVYSASVYLTSDIKNYSPNSDTSLTYVISEDSKKLFWVYNPDVYDEDTIKELQGRYINMLANMPADKMPAGNTSLLSEKEADRLIFDLNATQKEYNKNICIHNLIEEQAEKLPLAAAVVSRGKTMNFRELNSKSNQLARYLAEKGIGSDQVVGIYIERSADMLVAITAVHKAGAAYLPLDPLFPSERISYMLSDSECSMILTSSRMKTNLPRGNAGLVEIDRITDELSKYSDTNVKLDVESSSLAYLIYTSGSTGNPKGVMVEHRNVINFLSAMDDHIGFSKNSAWLAVTSLSFDISVFELMYPLTRGFKVVLYSGEDLSYDDASETVQAESKNILFSLFYFSSYGGERNGNKYKLLTSGAKYADENNFYAVWTPERHFYDFGGLFPNPAVTSAAIASITKNVKLLAGSCVSPLHNPIRITEDWSVVDNLSNGRAGISFAPGWQPDDFVIMPENFENRKDLMNNQIEVVQKLWRGEEVTFINPKGKPVEVKTLPRPVQEELPVWITAAGNPETFQLAGEKGYNVLTHLLGQTLKEVEDKIKVYKNAWKKAGHAGEGHVTLMLHTFVGENDDQVKDVVKEPMKNYLKSSVNLIKAAAWSFPAFKSNLQKENDFALDNLTEDELNAVLDYAFDRYYHENSLFGSVETCINTVEKLKEINIDEIACLIDFGIDSDIVLDNLKYLNQLREYSNVQNRQDILDKTTIPELIWKHNITHFQCTPSMAKILAYENESLEALAAVENIMIGGEAFPPKLAALLREKVRGRIYNMYGPTETTIWSTLHELVKVDGSIPIGKPIANTQIYILDSNQQPVPFGRKGELCIGGDGVVRGYYNNQLKTAEKFIDDPFNGNNKLYKTGDLAKYNQDGTIEYLGRIDHQIKIRGYRIETGEIESVMTQFSNVKEAVVIPRKNSDQLAGYFISNTNDKVDETRLKNYLRKKLPEYMVPAVFIRLEQFPLTPNGKIDRNSFPDDYETRRSDSDKHTIEPADEIEKQIAEIWEELLGIERVSTDDNFFDLGGHSLLAVQLHSKIKKLSSKEISLIDIFKYPTISALGKYLSQNEEEVTIERVNRAHIRKKSFKDRKLARLENRSIEK